MTEPDEQPEAQAPPGPPEENVQVWKASIHAEAEVIPGDPVEPEED